MTAVKLWQSAARTILTARVARQERTQRKVKGNIHWLSVAHAHEAEVRLYDRLFTHAQPDAGGQDYMSFLNPDSEEDNQGVGKIFACGAEPEDAFSSTAHGYFIADIKDVLPGKPVFNRAVTLRDSWIRRAQRRDGFGRRLKNLSARLCLSLQKSKQHALRSLSLPSAKSGCTGAERLFPGGKHHGVDVRFATDGRRIAQLLRDFFVADTTHALRARFG